MDFARVTQSIDGGWSWRLIAFDGGRTLDQGGPHPTKKACVADIVAHHPDVRVEQKPAD